MTQHSTRILGSVLAASVGLFLFYLGSNAVSHSKRKAANPKPVAQKGQPAVPNDHEAKMLAEELKRKPGHVPVLFRLAQLSEESGHPQDAARYLREAVKQEPDNADARLELGKVLYETGDVAGSLDETKKILDKQPNQADALYNLGAVYANLGNADLARQYWQRLVQSSPDSESGKRAKESLGRLVAQAR
jgi:tetratricopeptide (TPR) repeat protein